MPDRVAVRRGLRIELAAAAIALVASVGVVAAVASTSSWLLYTDGDSVIVPLMVGSVLSGRPQDWAMSPVLFLPESVVFGMLSALGLGMRATLTLNAVVNLLALYAAVRVVAGRRRPDREPALAALAGFGVFGLLTLLEGSAAAPGFQLATLLATTTYYSATVVAAVAVVGLVRRGVEGPRPRLVAGASAIVAAISVLTNPLFAVWAAAPLVLVLAALALARRIPVRRAVLLGGSVLAGSAGGYLARALFSPAIVAAGDNYLRADRWSASAAYFATVVADTVGTWHGMLWLLVVAVSIALAGVQAVRAWRRGDAPVALVCATAVIAPVATTLGAIALGSDADRYLQPWVFLPVLAFAVLPLRPVPRRMRAGAAVALSLTAATVLAVAVPTASAQVRRPDPDLSCVVDWVDASGRTGAGQFWTVRAPKALVADPTRLVQVDHTLRVYDWLVNRDDGRHARVSFLVRGTKDAPFLLPVGFEDDRSRRVACGRYTIVDFGDRVLPLGPPRN